ncbi:transcriptional repressor ILP1-like [Primulina huaijiensis]|uniref:transcriptional repressor ILP1-like n=1 Tax=Primulina huaijiensis TaxID=1492673 RepID=UPI003CC6EF58
MSSAKSRNFRRRGGDDDEEDDSATLSTSVTAKIKGASSTARRPHSASSKPKKTSTPTAKSLLSFAEDEESSESPFSRSSSKPSSSSSRFSGKSAHKLTSSKDRSAPHPPSSSLPSNVQPQPGSYTKEALLELQKNTKTLAAPARNKPKPEPEPVIVLKGLVKPIVANDFGSETAGKIQDFEDDEVSLNNKSGILTMERDDESDLARLGKLGLGKGLRDDDEVIPDQATIEAIRAKRERLRKAKAATPDYIALDGGSNHGAADGLSDEEPEFKGRIGFFGEEVGGDKKGVFEDFEDRAMPKYRVVERISDEEDEEDKMWEEEQVRKGLGKRLDDGVVNQGVGASASCVGNVHHSAVDSQQSFGYSGIGPGGMHPAVQNLGGSSYSSIGGAVGGLFGPDVMSISVQADLTKKALNENLSRVKLSHGRTMVSLANNEENLSSSLLNVTSLEDSFSAAGEKFLFMQKLRDFVSVLCEFLQHKAPFIEELEEQMQKLHEERARAITERRAADNDDEIPEIEQAVIAVRAEFRKGGSNSAKIAAAVAASSNSRALKNAPVELDDLGRDLNLKKRMDMTRRAEARQRRRAKSDSKRKLSIENDRFYSQMEGESSTDESDSESTAYESTRNQLLQVADKIFSDADEEYSQFSIVVERFDRWKKVYASSYLDAYMALSIPSIFSPYVRLELLKWDPLHEDADFIDMAWHSVLFAYGVPGNENRNGRDDSEADSDANLIPVLVDKLAIPILHHQLSSCWDTLSTLETTNAVSAMNLVVRYVDHSSSALGDLVAVLRDRLTNAVADLMVPTWSPVEMNTVSNAARVAAYRFGTAVRLMRNLCLWNKILSMHVLEKIALDELLCGKILPHLHVIHSNIHDAIFRTERVIASMNGVWTGPSVTGDRSRKLQALVDYLLLIGKTLEKKLVSGNMETETGKLVRRLRKMLVELNEYDHARALSRTFNLKEAL